MERAHRGDRATHAAGEREGGEELLHGAQQGVVVAGGLDHHPLDGGGAGGGHLGQQAEGASQEVPVMVRMKNEVYLLLRSTLSWIQDRFFRGKLKTLKKVQGKTAGELVIYGK